MKIWENVSSDRFDNELLKLLVENQADKAANSREAHSHNEQPNNKSTNDNQGERKRNKHHTQYQTQEMETFFKECANPNEKQRRDLGRELGLDPLQVKFWFQNKRNRVKYQHERKAIAQLHAENEKLRSENIQLKKSVSFAWSNCGTSRASNDDLKLQNARLKDEIGFCAVISKNVRLHNVKHWARSSIPSLNQGSLEHKGGVSGAFGFNGGKSQLLKSLNGPIEVDRSLTIELAVLAAEEIAVMARIGEPIWVPDFDHNVMVLNEEEYFKTFQRAFTPKLVGFKSEASREYAVIIMNPLSILEIFMDISKWLAIFSGMISKAMVHEVLSAGTHENYNGALQVMSAEFQALSPAIPSRDYMFVRYCKQLGEGAWAVVDVSIDTLVPGGPMASCQRRPSGCIIEAMTNGCSKIIWVEHVEFQHHNIHSISKSIISSGYAYGAKRWMSILERQCERLTSAMDITNYPYYRHLNKIDLESRKSFSKLAERMFMSFCGGIMASADAYQWTTISGNGVDEVRIMTRKNQDYHGTPSGLLISASLCFWIPVLPKIVFDYLCNERTRPEWDFLANGGVVEEMAYIGNGKNKGNCVTLLRVNNANTKEAKMLIVQESNSEPTTSFIVYAPVDIISVNVLFGGGNPDNVQLLPFGFTILPSGPPGCKGGVGDDDGMTNGALLSIAFQILADSAPYAKLSNVSVAIAKNLIESTMNKIKIALGVMD